MVLKYISKPADFLINRAIILAMACKVESANTYTTVSKVYLGPATTVKLDIVLCCFFLVSTVVSNLISALLKPMLLIRFFMLKTDCFNGASVKMVGFSMTDTGMKNGKEGHGIFDATLIWALSSI